MDAFPAFYPLTARKVALIGLVGSMMAGCASSGGDVTILESLGPTIYQCDGAKQVRFEDDPWSPGQKGFSGIATVGGVSYRMVKVWSSEGWRYRNGFRGFWQHDDLSASLHGFPGGPYLNCRLQRP